MNKSLFVLVILLALCTTVHAKMCSITTKDGTGKDFIYYRMVGTPTKNLTGVVATVPPCNNETLTINALPCPVCKECAKCANNRFGGTETYPKLPNGNCFANYDATVVVNGEQRCSIQ